MRKTLKEPCSDCPWRRCSAPGWLGASTAEEFLEATLADAQMPCHQTIDYEKENWRRDQLPTAPFCVGSLIFLANICKLPRDRELSDAMEHIAQDKENVFAMPAEFLKHHGG